MASCNSCGATITWAYTITGKAAPMERADDGTWIIDDEGITRQSKNPKDKPRYRSHFASCPQAQQWRGARRG